MKISVNQIEINIQEGTTLQSLVEAQGMNTKGIAIAIDNKIISRTQWTQTILTEAAKVVVIQATYGG